MWAFLFGTALAGSPQGTLTTEASVTPMFKPGFNVQVDYGVWKGLWVGGRYSANQEAYIYAQNLGDFQKTGTWYHGLFAGGGIRAVVGKNDRWDIDIGAYFGPELAFVREQVRYVNSGDDYTVYDRRFYQSWQAGLMLVPPTLRYRFAQNHGVVFQTWLPLSQLSAIERIQVSLGWTARWGGERVGSGGRSKP